MVTPSPKSLSHIEKQLYTLLDEYMHYVMKYCTHVRTIFTVRNPAKRISEEELDVAIATVERLISVAKRLQRLLKELQKKVRIGHTVQTLPSTS